MPVPDTAAEGVPASDGGRRRAYVVGGLLVVLLVLPFVVFAVPQLVGASHSYVATSDHMAGPPVRAITTGDIVFVYETEPEQIARGDVIAYRSAADRLTTGRVVGVRTVNGAITFETVGDADAAASPRAVAAEQVAGTVTPTFPHVGRGSVVLPYVGYVVLFVHPPYGIELAAVPLLLLVVINRRLILAALSVARDELWTLPAVTGSASVTLLTATGAGKSRVATPVDDASSELVVLLEDLGVDDTGSELVAFLDDLSVDDERGRRLLYAGSVVALGMMLLPFVVFAVPQLAGASNSYIVVSDSMAASPPPVLQAGDVVFVYDTPPERVEASDVLTYRTAGGQVTTHRVVGVQDTESGLYFKTKGDANEEADRVPVPAERVIGTVGFSLPLIGHVLAFASTIYGFALLVVVPVLLLVATETWTFAAGTRSSNTESATAIDGQDTSDSTGPVRVVGIDCDDSAVGDVGVTAPAEPVGAGGAEQASEPAGYMLTRLDLRLTLLVMTGFGAYSTIIAFFARQVWATMVATTALASLALLAGLYYWGGWENENEAAKLSEPTNGTDATADLWSPSLASTISGTRPAGATGNGRDASTVHPGLNYAERGAVAKATDGLLDGYIGGIEQFEGLAQKRLVTETGELTPAGRLFLAGMLTGTLGTIRTFDDVTEVTPADGEELREIAELREAEFANNLSATRTTTGAIEHD